MELAKALRVEAGEVIAFVGAGGKTSAIRKLVEELAADFPVLVTTSTKLALDESDLAEEHEIIEDAGGLITVLSDWDHDKALLLTGPQVPDEPKWGGLPLAQLQDVIEFSREKKVVLLIEADGAGGRSIKAPAAHEPALPHNLDLLVPVVGIDALGERVDSELVHRSELVGDLLGVDGDTRLTAKHIATLLIHPSGGLKTLPLHAELRVVLNKVETDESLLKAQEIAGLALQESKIQSVIIGSMQGEEPVRQARGRVAGIVLAAGESERFPGMKLLHEIDGKPMLAHVLDAVRSSRIHRRVIVLGHEHESILKAVDCEGFQVVNNAEWSQGQSTSVQAGLEAVSGEVEAVIYPLGDMPLIDAGLINQIIDRHAETLAPIVAPQVGKVWGNPVLFDRITFPTFSELKGDRGGKLLFERFEVEPVEAAGSVQRDVDRPADLKDLEP
jgi:molybdenum cofactor cytidylyltransferase